LLSAAIIAIDEFGHPQHMWIMNLVWPITGLYAEPIALAFYFRYGRLATHAKAHRAMQHGDEPPSRRQIPFPIMVAKGAFHCGGGCTLGDIVSEWLAFAWPSIALAFGFQSLFSEKMFAVWVLDFILAFLLGIAFQYFTIKPMRDLSVGEGLVAALKADTFSLCAWQVGMYGFMALAQFYLFGTLLGTRLRPIDAEFWFMMQLAMLTGFATSYPVNWWLIEAGLKERM
jgi:branched-subunit amino acid transport protein